jgi:multidrug resistance efflux pump
MSEASYKAGSISDLEFKKAEDEYNNTKNKYEAGKLDMEEFTNVHISAAEEGIIFDSDKVLFSKRDQENQIEILASDIELNKHKIQREMKDYEMSVLRSPVDGVINEIMVNPGEVVQPGQKLMTITPPGKEWVDAYIDEKDISHVRIGAKTKVIFKSMPDKVFKGVISYISSSIQPEDLETTTYGMKIKSNPIGNNSDTDKFLKIRVDYNNEDIQLPNGISATVLIAEK